MANPVDAMIDPVGDCWIEFSNFWTESIPQFFTETIPQAFQDAWDATAKWVEECVMPFFKDCENWFSENAEWLWPVAVAFVAGFSFVVGIALLCLCCPNQEEGKGDGDPADVKSKKPLSATTLEAHEQAKIAAAMSKLEGASPAEMPKVKKELRELNETIRQATEALNEIENFLEMDASPNVVCSTSTKAERVLVGLRDKFTAAFRELEAKHKTDYARLNSLQERLTAMFQNEVEPLQKQARYKEIEHREATDILTKQFERLKAQELVVQRISQERASISADLTIEEFYQEIRALANRIVDSNREASLQRIQELRESPLGQTIQRLETLPADAENREDAVLGLRAEILELAQTAFDEKCRDALQEAQRIARILSGEVAEEGSLLQRQAAIAEATETLEQTKVQYQERIDQAWERLLKARDNLDQYSNTHRWISEKLQRLTAKEAIADFEADLERAANPPQNYRGPSREQLQESRLGQFIRALNKLGEEEDKTELLGQILGEAKGKLTHRQGEFLDAINQLSGGNTVNGSVAYLNAQHQQLVQQRARAISQQQEAIHQLEQDLEAARKTLLEKQTFIERLPRERETITTDTAILQFNREIRQIQGQITDGNRAQVERAIAERNSSELGKLIAQLEGKNGEELALVKSAILTSAQKTFDARNQITLESARAIVMTAQGDANVPGSIAYLRAGVEKAQASLEETRRALDAANSKFLLQQASTQKETAPLESTLRLCSHLRDVIAPMMRAIDEALQPAAV